jgi:ribonucleoside-diphosphate reductase beta chain
MPKPEIGSVGATFAESEVRHQDAYSHLLEVL